jgi:hypothetical protein
MERTIDLDSSVKIPSLQQQFRAITISMVQTVVMINRMLQDAVL